MVLASSHRDSPVVCLDHCKLVSALGLASYLMGSEFLWGLFVQLAPSVFGGM